MKKLIVLCGLIGSGKTTFAMKNFRHFTDLDYMPQGARKEDQIKWTERLLEKHNEVCHVTCFPNPVEWEYFKDKNAEFIWINTSIKQCKTNIIIRNRPRDMENISRVFNANQEFLRRRTRSTIPFRVVDVFPRSFER
jgi:adenylate kinase family enzyme